MDNKDSGTNLAFWLPGSAVILSLVVSTFALTREPFLELRPSGEQFQAQLPIEARLWQDPFDALERYRKKLKGTSEDEHLCADAIASVPEKGTAPAPEIMVALVEGGPYANEVERRRRTRYALLAGFKNSHRVPDQEQYIHCLQVSTDLLTDQSAGARTIEVPYEVFVSSPFDPPQSVQGTPLPSNKTYVFWLKQDTLGPYPLLALEKLRRHLACKTRTVNGDPDPCNLQPGDIPTLKVIGPATSAVLRDMFQGEDAGQATPTVEIYSPLATADNRTLDQGYAKRTPALLDPPRMKLLRTVSDDGTMTKLILDELKLRGVDPSTSVRCNEGIVQRVGSPCARRFGGSNNRIALITEWDSFYSRALTESFKAQVAENARLRDEEKPVIDQSILRFSYLRGLDGRLPEDGQGNEKTTSADSGKNNKADTGIDLSPLEKSSGNSQLDYLRRLADHIAKVDSAYRGKGENGIGAIGVLGVDTYDKLLVLQALKSRMPYKLYFSTNLDALMLQRGQAQITRNLILAAPYGLELTRALQQDVPPFRDSLQSSVFISVLAALAPQPFAVKRAKFDYSKSELLSPDIYEIGTSGFIPLASEITASRPASCEAPAETEQGVRPHDLMALRCLQDRSQPPYPETSQSARDRFTQIQSYFRAGPLTVILLLFAGLIVWRWISGPQKDNKLPPANWVRGVPMALYMIAVVCAFIATRYWHAEFLWLSFGLILAGIITSNLTRSAKAGASLAADVNNGVYDSTAWYIVVPLVMYILLLMLAYQMRSTLTNNGFGEPMFLFEGISSWPTAALRVLAFLISISALAWGWRNLRINRSEIERSYHLSRFMRRYHMSVWSQIILLKRRGKDWDFRGWCNELGHWLLLALLPLSTASVDWENSKAVQKAHKPLPGGRKMISTIRFWAEHCVCGSFGARLLRAMLFTWIYLVVTSVLFVAWPVESIPVRGQLPIWEAIWMLSNVMFHLLVFWVVDANLLLTRFIRQLSNHHAIWPRTLQREHEMIFGTLEHECIDEWVDLQLIAKRTSAVSRLIYAPTVVMLILIASRSTYFDNWQTPPGTVIMYLLTGLILLVSALSLRRAAEKARTIALQRVDDYLLKTPADTPYYDKFRMIRERIVALNTGSFSRYSEEPLVRALLLSLTGIGGSALVDALNYAKF